jgi:putative transposase
MTQFKWVQSSQSKNFGGIRDGPSSMRVLAYCLMPNHYHLALWPRADGDMSRWMHWLMTTHVRRYLGRYRSGSHVWQGRFKACTIHDDEHLFAVLR